MISLILTVVVVILLEIYAFQSIKTLARNRMFKIAWIVITALVYANFLYAIISSPRSEGQSIKFQFGVGIFLTVLIPKIIIVLFLLGEDAYRFGKRGLQLLYSTNEPVASRREFLSKIAYGIAAIPFAGFLYGIIEGKYNYKVLRYRLEFDDLPEAFDGFTITQISDIHSGSFTNKKKIGYGVDLINKQQSDMILFTGDIVNDKADEMDAWVDMFKTLKAPYGKYSILGNHDYGDYITWKTAADKKANFKKVRDIHPKIGFELLMNEHRYVEKDGEKLALVGVENWGRGFNKAGDLAKASQGVCKDDFKILLSHDPSHWELKVKQDDFNYQLTLSGHTHGLQMGIEIPGFLKWSPSKYVYKQWAGLYEEFGRYINVNRGFGYHAFPGRVGIWPEITVIELKKKTKTV